MRFGTFISSLFKNFSKSDNKSESLSAAGGTKTASTIDAPPIQF